MEAQLKKIVGQFDIQGVIKSIKPLGAGHINDSYKVFTESANTPDYVLQHINHYIFKNIDALQDNIRRVTDHIRKKLLTSGVKNVGNHVLRIASTLDGKLYFTDADCNYWRIYYFIPDSHSYDEGITPELALYAGRAFGDFQAMLSDLSGEPLVEIIPDFHNMESRLAIFRQAVKDNKAERLVKTQYMVDEIEKRANYMCKAERMYREGTLPKRINHCDAKVNNVLFDKNNHVLCVVDLDTVMPGYVLSDFGDFMRTGANTGKEDDPYLDNISIDMNIFEAYTKGYLEKAKSFLLPVEIENLAFGAKLLTYMQTVRFFADYLDGDLYYKIHYPEHNWQRTVAQFKLLQNMEEKFNEMRRIVTKAAQ